MALDTYVTNRLIQWANWRLRKLDGGLGYPKKSAFVINPGGGEWCPEMDARCVEVDKAICVLLPERKDVLMQCYTTIGTKEQKAKRCGISIRTYDARLDMAHHELLGYLNDLACGVALPVIDVDVSWSDKRFFSMEV